LIFIDKVSKRLCLLFRERCSSSIALSTRISALIKHLTSTNISTIALSPVRGPIPIEINSTIPRLALLPRSTLLSQWTLIFSFLHDFASIVVLSFDHGETILVDYRDHMVDVLFGKSSVVRVFVHKAVEKMETGDQVLLDCD
jgi:hypothetical protein